MRLALASTLKNRTNETDKDARLLNAFVETKRGVVNVVKRPSIVATFSALEGGAGAGQGLFSYSTPEGVETLVGIQNDVLNNAPTSVVTTLAFTTQPVNWKIATAMSPSVVVTAQDSFGNTITSYTGTVTIALYANPSGGTLSGTLSVAAVSGVATFSNLKLDVVGGSYKFKATASGLRTAISSVFKIISNLSFTVQPGNSRPGVTFDTPPEVSIVDSSSAVITGYVGNVTVAIGTNPASGTLSGTLTVAAVNGVASFANLEIDNLGDGYTLVASADAGNLVNTTSNSFNISNNYSYTMVSVNSGAGAIGFIDGSLGSLTPTAYLAGNITAIYNGTGPNDGLIVAMTGSTSQSHFTSITVGGITKLSADAASYVGGQWEWSGASVVTTEGSIAVTVTP